MGERDKMQCVTSLGAVWHRSPRLVFRKNRSVQLIQRSQLFLLHKIKLRHSSVKIAHDDTTKMTCLVDEEEKVAVACVHVSYSSHCQCIAAYERLETHPQYPEHICGQSDCCKDARIHGKVSGRLFEWCP